MLSLAMLLSFAAGCSENENTSNSVNNNKTEFANETEPATESEESIQYEEEVFYQSSNCKMTFRGLEIVKRDREEHLQFTYEVENIGNSRAISYDYNSILYNDFKIYSDWNNFNLEPGTKEIVNTFVSRSDLEDAGIEQIETIAFTGYVDVGNYYDLEDYDLEDLDGAFKITLNSPYKLVWEE